MKQKVQLKGTAPYSQSKFFTSEKQDGETADAFEKRAWPEHAHIGDDGTVVVPTFGLKTMLDSAAKYIGDKVPGDGKRTFSAIIRSGVQVQAKEPVLLCSGKPVTKKEFKPEWIMAHSNGIRGSGKRVPRCFPVFRNWAIDVEFETIDPRITEAVLIRHLVAAGQYIGIGRFRPENGGSYGRFEVYVNGKKAQELSIQRKVEAAEEEE